MSDTRVFFRDIRPYYAPERWSDLCGPAAGSLRLPMTVFWRAPDRQFSLDDEVELAEAYRFLVVEGDETEQGTLLNPDLLQAVWSRLVLPTRVRELWEARFPHLGSRS